jgi:hypothetical protein
MGISVVEFTDPANAYEVAYADPDPLLNPNNPAAIETGGDWSTYWYNASECRRPQRRLAAQRWPPRASLSRGPSLRKDQARLRFTRERELSTVLGAALAAASGSAKRANQTTSRIAEPTAR